MKIFVNDKKQIIEPDCSIEKLLKKNNISDTRGVAIAVNEQVIPKNKWNENIFKENDKVILIKAAKGG